MPPSYSAKSRQDALAQLLHKDIGQGYKRLKNNRGQPCDKSRGWHGLKGACERIKKGGDIESAGKRSRQNLAAKIRKEKSMGSVKAADTDTSPVFKAMRKAEDRIREQRFETLMAFGQDGKEIVSIDGKEFSVSVSDANAPLFKDAIATHNHPRAWAFDEGTPGAGGNSFSDDDILLAVGLDMKEIRAVSRGYRFSLSRPDGGWPSASVVARQISKAEEAVRTPNMKKIKAASGSERQALIDVAEAEHYHRKALLVSKAIGSKYSRKPWSKERGN